ncbi:MAE_28990/MAE_18760 family HEPN-like nuclease [Rodentibacter pneumotropicus]|uniref:MAE_28990/MAE_18760 family HEPN-like nuclease n=1 Tax=Rodentibacter pneumotropicus TaxID=758 RepID=UPI00232F3829|nr:MAE_28990/MAE_18760 family HEPN-like nuclease [Rodentibacter pneumotropicus]MDC2826652.1 MAE_28990/MAE_18760 family HEPN-like nuclease [Rodentibacter pneumotropicus]
MKIKSASDCIDYIAKDIAWRKKEITSLIFLIEKSRKHEKNILMKSALVLFYSHWEGHIKSCSIAYLNFLNHQGIKYCHLKENFHHLSLGENFRSGFSISKIQHQIELYKHLSTIHDKAFKVKEENIIDTNSNLKYDILDTILLQLGFHSTLFSQKELFINEILLNNRNAIAHGELRDNKSIEDAYNEVKEHLLPLIEAFNTLVSNAVASSSYLITPME